MYSYDILPNITITSSGHVSDKFLQLGISSLKDAAKYIHEIPYGYNTDRNDVMIIFRENRGTCSTKHYIIAALGQEMNIPIYKYTGIYRMDEKTVTGTETLLIKYGLPYIPMIHCYLNYRQFSIDLTEGNKNGKNTPINEFLYSQKVKPDISEKEEYLIYRKALSEHIIKLPEIKNNSINTILEARTEGLMLLKSKIG